MPCEGPSGESCRTVEMKKHRAELLIYLLGKLGAFSRKAEAFVKDPWSSSKDYEAQVDLCTTLRSLSEAEIERIVYDAKNPMARKLADFWEQHQNDDAEREKREALERTCVPVVINGVRDRGERFSYECTVSQRLTKTSVKLIGVMIPDGVNVVDHVLVPDSPLLGRVELSNGHLMNLLEPGTVVDIEIKVTRR